MIDIDFVLARPKRPDEQEKQCNKGRPKTVQTTPAPTECRLGVPQYEIGHRADGKRTVKGDSSYHPHYPPTLHDLDSKVQH
jgi:hypothetical protein